MGPTIRTHGRWLAVASLALLLSGCVRVDMELEVSPENTVSGAAILAVDESILELTGQNADQLFQDMDTTSDLPPGAAVESYAEDGFVGQRITFDAVPLAEFSQGGLTETGEELSIVRRGDDFHVTGQLDMTGSDFGGEEVPAGVLDSVEFRIAITFPGPVRSATGEVDGNTVTWTPRVGENTRIQAVASAIPSSSPLLPIVLIGAGVILLGALVFLLVSRRGTPAPATGWHEPPTGGVAPGSPPAAEVPPTAPVDAAPATAPVDGPPPAWSSGPIEGTPPIEPVESVERVEPIEPVEPVEPVAPVETGQPPPERGSPVPPDDEKAPPAVPPAPD